MRSPQRTASMRIMAGLGLVLASSLALTGCSSGSDTAGSGGAGLDSSSGSRSSGPGGSASDDAGPAISTNGKNSDVVTASADVTGAASGQVRDGTMTLTYAEGSKEDMSSFSACRAISLLINDDAGLIHVYPDGELDCRAEQ